MITRVILIANISTALVTGYAPALTQTFYATNLSCWIRQQKEDSVSLTWS